MMKGSDQAIRPMPDEVDVAVVGAGPTGLMLATMLQSFGIRTVVLEKMDDPAKHSRAAAIHARTLETLEPLGIVGEMVERGHIVPRFGARDRSKRLLGIDFHQLPTAYPYVLMLPQDETEFLMRDALRKQGGEIFWSCEVTGVQQEVRAVDLTVQSGGDHRRIRARYAVGCDGAHSFVREAVGIPFEGATYPQSFILADVYMKWGLPDDEVQLFFSPEGLVVVAPLPKGRHRVVAVDHAPPEPSQADIQALLDSRGPYRPRPRIEKVVWSSRFRVHHRIAARFRSKNVFLCGDAAHIHSPAGGQGMNTGIQDAANLAWKLTHVLRNDAPESLLDSYERERRPIAEDVVSTTDRLTRLATMRSTVACRFRNLLLHIADRKWLTRRMAMNLSGISHVYHEGWKVDDFVTVQRWTFQQESHSDPAFKLLVPPNEEEKAREMATAFSDIPVRIIPAPELQQTLLIRPDGFIAGREALGQYARLLELLARAYKV